MPIATILLGILLLAMGSLPTVAGHALAGSIRQRMPQAMVHAAVKAVPTWRVLAGQVDQAVVDIDLVRFDGLPLRDIQVRSGPFAGDGPIRLQMGFLMELPAFRAMVEHEAGQYLSGMAAEMGLPGTGFENVDVQIQPGPLPFHVTGTVNAFGGLVSMNVEIAGMPAILPGSQLGLRHAVVSVNDQQQQVGEVPLFALPALPEGVSVAITGVQPAADDRARVSLAVAAPNMQAIRELLSGQGAGSPTATP